jgi:hypothetical protein
MNLYLTILLFTISIHGTFDCYHRSDGCVGNNAIIMVQLRMNLQKLIKNNQRILFQSTGSIPGKRVLCPYSLLEQVESRRGFR